MKIGDRQIALESGGRRFQWRLGRIVGKRG